MEAGNGQAVTLPELAHTDRLQLALDDLRCSHKSPHDQRALPVGRRCSRRQDQDRLEVACVEPHRGAVTVALAILLLPGWLAAVVVIVLAVLAITADVVIRRRISR